MRAFLIPARGGSRGILDKNLADLGGVQLIGWTIAAAREATASLRGLGMSPDQVYVSSEDDKILDVAEALGAMAHKRPDHLGTDQASMKDVVRDFFKTHTEISDVVLLYPTVPFRSAGTIVQALAFYDQTDLNASPEGSEGCNRSLMSVHECRSRPFGGVQIINGRMVFGEDAEAYYRKQDTPALCHANGAIYVIHREEIDALNNQLFNQKTLPFIMHGHENLDIDTPQDLELARGLVAIGVVKAPAEIRRTVPVL